MASALLPEALDTSRELSSTAELRAALEAQPNLLDALQEADLLVGERYYEPGFIALALGKGSKAQFTTFNSDARGFAFWQPRDGFAGRSGIVFGFNMPARDRADPAQRRGWLSQLNGLEPLGAIQLQRGKRPGPVVRFYRFGPLKTP